MPATVRASYGSWKSPITTDLIVADTVKLGQLCVDGEDVYWVEMRPSEGARNVVVRQSSDGSVKDVTPPLFNIRTLTHEYGGGAFTVHKGVVYFVNYKDQAIYVQKPDKTPSALTEPGKQRYADLTIDAHHNRLLCICEDHSGENEAANTIIAIDLESGDSHELAAGADFYSNPCISPDGKQLTWLSWNHPNMPWDGTELWLADVDGLDLKNIRQVAGGETESVFQPRWSPDGTLHFVSDRTGWWNLYRIRGERIEHVLKKQAEFGLPQWIFGMSTYSFESDTRIICTFFEKGIWYLGLLDTTEKTLEVLDLPFTYIECLHSTAGMAAFVAGAGILPNAIIRLNPDNEKFIVVRKSADLELDSTFLSRPEPIEFPTEKGRTAHAYFYPPQNRDYEGPGDERPPLIVKSHGGPTASTSATVELRIQYWTSRGVAVLDVNYGGSTGYGREYRSRLDGQWGIVDVDDCINGAKFLIDKGLVDPERIAIAGGSAGGYTTLSALTFRDFFKAGASYYGISDLEALAKETHKFESRYLDRLIGPYPERRDLYVERSPIHFTDRLSCPVILMQGLEDRVVPPEQAELMVEALKQKGLPVAYLTFEGEQHGFRKAENIKRSLEAELYFYSRIFGFTPADNIEPVEIFNLP